MEPREQILLVGDPRLRVRCGPVADFADPGMQRDCSRLLRALEQFRAEHGFGRAIAAPQVGILRRIVAMNLGSGPFLLINPEILDRSAEQFTLWDDCLSFPWLMVRLQRHMHVDVQFRTEAGELRVWQGTGQAVAELVQHEVDHLDGVLALDHALDRDSIIARQVYEARREWFDSQVDYTISPTL